MPALKSPFLPRYGIASCAEKKILTDRCACKVDEKILIDRAWKFLSELVVSQPPFERLRLPEFRRMVPSFFLLFFLLTKEKAEERRGEGRKNSRGESTGHV